MLGILLSYAYVRWRAKPKTRIIAEFWVYLAAEKMPAQDDVMSHLMQSNPFPGFTTKEALLFSDVRVRINSVIRLKNMAAFRPDLFNGGTLTVEQIEALANCPQFIKIKFASEEPTRDRRYLTFLMHVAAAYATLGDGQLIYDFVLARPYSPEEFFALMHQKVDLSGPEIQTEIRWVEDGDILSAESAGLIKVGIPDLRAEDVAPDTRILTESLLQAAIRHIWLLPTLPKEIEIEEYGDTFKLIFMTTRNGYVSTRVTRIQAI